MGSAVTGTRADLLGSSGVLATAIPSLKTLTLAFATGTCGSENWGGISAANFVSTNINALNAQGVNYIVSTGGAAGTFSCPSASGLATFINRYMTPHLVGIDFDIEGGQASSVQQLVQAVAGVQNQFPNLRFSFTLATWAASDGSYAGINALGDATVKAILAAGLKNYTVDLMVMDYGKAGANVCVLNASGACDMGLSAIQAAKNLQHTYGVPYSKIELTPMIGVNDTSDEIFTIQNVTSMDNFVKANGLAGVHYWSFDRDNPCGGGYASPTCNGLPSTSVLQYTKQFISELGSR